MTVMVSQKEEGAVQATSAGSQDAHLDQRTLVRALHDHVLGRLPKTPINLRVRLKVAGSYEV